MLVSTTIDGRAAPAWFIGTPTPRQLKLLRSKRQPYWWLKVILGFALVGVLIADDFVVLSDGILIAALATFAISLIVDRFVRCRWFDARSALRQNRSRYVSPTSPSFIALRPDLVSGEEWRPYKSDIDQYFRRFAEIDKSWSRQGVTDAQREEARKLMTDRAKPIVSGLGYEDAYKRAALGRHVQHRDERELAEAGGRHFETELTRARTYQSL